MKIPILIIVCAFVYYLYLLRVKYERWKNPNLYMALLKRVVQIENRTSCWACSMKPEDSEGLSLVATPIKSEVLVHQNLTGQNITTGRGNTRRIGVLKLMPGSTPSICITINRTREWPQTFLGALRPSYCNDAQFVFSMLWKNATEEGRSEDSWSLGISHMMLIGGLRGYMNYLKVGIKTLCNFSLPGTPNTTCRNLLQLGLAMIGAGTPLNVSRLMFPHGSVTLQPPYYFVCGRWAYTWLPTSSYGRCTIATLAPAIAILEKNRTTETNLLLQHLWSKMEWLTTQDYPWAWSPSWTRWHMDAMIRLNNYSGIIEAMFEEAVEETTVYSVEMSQESKLAFHRKLAEDYKLFAQGGLCMIVDGDCCTWIGDSGDIWVGDSEDTIYNHLKKVKKLQNKARETGHEGWYPFKKITISNIFGAMGVFSGAMTAFAIMVPMLILLQYRIRLAVRGKARETGYEGWSTGSFFRQITVY